MYAVCIAKVYIHIYHSYIPNTYMQNFACICMYGMYVHVYACICMYEPKYACCQQQQMNSSEIPRGEPEPEKQQTQTAKDVRELNNIHNWIWSPDFTVVPIPVPHQLASESLRLCPILTESRSTHTTPSGNRRKFIMMVYTWYIPDI